MQTALICIVLLGLLLFGLGLAVSLTRASTKTNYGCKNDPTDPLTKLVRAHGNTAEYAPMLALLMLLVGTRNPAEWAQWVMIAVTAIRYVFVAGLVIPATMDRPNPMRFIGALGTYLCGAALCVALVMTI